MTPMIDIVFLLIVFFMLIAQLTQQERIELELPRLGGEMPRRLTAQQPIVVNLVPAHAAGVLPGVRFGARTFAESERGLAELSNALRTSMAEREGAPVHLRAERTERYDRVHRILRLLAASGVRSAELVTEAHPRQRPGTPSQHGGTSP